MKNCKINYEDKEIILCSQKIWIKNLKVRKWKKTETKGKKI